MKARRGVGLVAVAARLARLGLLTPANIVQLAAAVARDGGNLAALLTIAAARDGDRLAIVDPVERLTYRALAGQVQALAATLRRDHAIGPGSNVALSCRNSAAGARMLFAIARTGANLFLLDPDAGDRQRRALDARYRFDLVLDDADSMAGAACPPSARLPRARGGAIVVLTGGTTSEGRAARRRQAAAGFVHPFVALVGTLHLDRYDRVLLATPMFHGFGLAALVVGTVLGKTIHLMPRFDAAAACALVARERIAAMAVVPVMLRRMLVHDADALATLRCIACGGAPLGAVLAQATRDRLGEVLFNLYGTSEAGLCAVATPAQLAAAPDTIGTLIGGACAVIRDDAGVVPAGVVGRLCVRNVAAVDPRAWIDTGDLARRGDDGLFYLAGRSDEMIVSGGENVYPVVLEGILERHPSVRAAAVIGVADAEFGQRLKAFVVLDPGSATTGAGLSTWLVPLVARHERPVAIVTVDDLPLTAIGKVDKRALAVPPGGSAPVPVPPRTDKA
ncbi:class I adenylate-forming enzyme family protein [uncultured Sphingomonas sp.]|uniref:class I adenylate-forming enzyme family protein n=1 Tax=uncultured Sphingomonas sp. TaxID=158754 RepID=UPI0035CA613C